MESSLRPWNSRPRIVERQTEKLTFEVRLLENAPPPQQEVQVEAVLLSVDSGTVTLAPVPEEDDESFREAMMEELDVGAVAPVPRERSSGHPMFDPLTSITLFIPVPDFRQMAYVSIDDRHGGGCVDLASS